MIESYLEIEERERKANNRKAYAVQALCLIAVIGVFIFVGTAPNVTDPNDQAFLFLLGGMPFCGIGLYFSMKLR